MTAVVVDTNVAMVANGLAGQADAACEGECVRRLATIMRDGVLLVDELGLIVAEYVRSLGFAGRPGAGRAFAKWAHDNQYQARRCRRVSITVLRTGDWRRFVEFPAAEELAEFDPADQKFVAVALADAGGSPILNAVDRDWWEYRATLQKHGVRVDFVCPQQFMGR